jgi:hypothetical protein
VSPVTADADALAAANTLKDAGVDVTAGQKTGSKLLKLAESELGNAMFAGGKATAANKRTMDQFTGAVLNQGGIVGETRGTPEVIDRAFTDNGNAFDAIAARNPIIPLPQNFASNAQRIADDFEDLTGDRSSLLDRLVGALQTSKAGNVPNHISGETYQAVQSDIGRFARRAVGNPDLKMSLYDLKGELDDAVQNGLQQIGNGQDAAAWAQTRSQYKNLLVIERALANSTESANQGLITPTALANADRAISGRRAYVRGTSNFSDLAHAGNAILKPEANSNTAARSWLHLLPSAIGAFAGGAAEGLSPTGVLAGAGLAAAPGIAGRALMSRPVQAYLGNQAATSLRQGSLLADLLRSGALGSVSASQTTP